MSDKPSITTSTKRPPTSNALLYYEVQVASLQYRSANPLTYSYDQSVAPGVVVVVELKNKPVTAIIIAKVAKPTFATKPIIAIVNPTPLPLQLIKLMQWLPGYYPAIPGAITQIFAPNYLITSARVAAKAATTVEETPSSHVVTALPPLTPSQTDALAQLASNNQPALLHGDTGTGKTRIYIELARQRLSNNQSSLILTPEISLTPQLIQAFKAGLNAPVISLHSTQTPTERRRAWRAILEATTPVIIIGPRSSMFAPINNLGLVVIDECHDDAFKQEQAPHYVTSRVAGTLARLHQAKLVLGSATPLITDQYTFSAKGLTVVRLTTPALPTGPASEVSVVDLKDKSAFSASQWLSTSLIASIKQALSGKRQSLLFLNRRGTARLTLCNQCAWQSLCPTCDLPYTFHHDVHQLRCHTCGHVASVPTACPSCNSTDIIFKSIGTKTIAQEAQRLFPHARIARFDSDTPKDERVENQYQAIKSGDIDIIIGTQMITKGLDLPLLDTVGVILADTSLYFPDYTAEEKTFQMLTQVSGRVGRGHGTSTICIQTYNPGSFAIQSAISKDYATFYQQQIEERRDFRFPPFCYVLKINVDKKTSTAAKKAITTSVQSIKKVYPKLDVSEPAPCFTEKTLRGYGWQAIIKSPNRQALVRIIGELPKDIQYDIDPTTLL